MRRFRLGGGKREEEAGETYVFSTAAGSDHVAVFVGAAIAKNGLGALDTICLT